MPLPQVGNTTTCELHPDLVTDGHARAMQVEQFLKDGGFVFHDPAIHRLFAGHYIW